MQKRRGNRNRQLPLTEADIVKMSGGINVIFGHDAYHNKRRRKIKGGVVRWCDWNRQMGGTVIVVGLMIVTGWYLLGSTTSTTRTSGDDHNWMGGILRRHRTQQQHQPAPAVANPPPLAQFDTLQYPLHHAKLVGLYFAASWCPHSTPVTKALNEYFRDIILPPPAAAAAAVDDDTTSSTNDDDKEKALLAIVHVSSDTDQEKFDNYIQKNWITVPFDSPEQTLLKKHFAVCAKPEVETVLGINIPRQHEIPTLLIIDSETQTVLTAHGVDDVLYEYKETALQHWMELWNLVRAMEEKYTTTALDEELDTGGGGGERGDGTTTSTDFRPARNRRQRVNDNHGDTLTTAIGSLFGPN